MNDVKPNFVVRPKILIGAYGCEPGKGSEQGVGWNWILQIAHLAELVVVTRSNNRAAIEANLPDELNKHIRFVYYDPPKHIQAIKRKEKGLYLYYFFWQWGAYRLMSRELKLQPVDYAMHLTFGSVWMPTFMHRLQVPFIWGPVGGGEAVPWRLVRSLPPKGRLLQYVRYLLMATFEFNPFVANVARKARVILARTDDTARMFPPRYYGKTRVVLETAAPEEWFESEARTSRTIDDDALRVIYTGRLVAFKNVRVAIQAVAEARRRGKNIHFTIVGDGPLHSSLKDLATEEGIEKHVSFTGRLTQEAVMDQLRKHDVYLFPSLREAGPWSLMEAMSLGLPTICVNTSGMKVIADKTCARLVQPSSPSKMIDDFAHALGELAEMPEMRHEMGANARRRMEDKFRWPQKRSFMAKILEELDQGLL
jgi:glycosyltransferase involved in cell wall biosynthesis